MPDKVANNIKLGLFLLAGLLFLVVMLYMIGRNQHLFGKTYLLRSRFENVNGLVAGNNVRVSGIQAGTVKGLKFLSDTVIEVSMLIDQEMKTIIRRNAVVSIGTDGLVGNKVVNIVPGPGPAPLATEGDLLGSKKAVNTEEILQTLARTNNDVAVIASELKTTVERINKSNGLWQLINDESIPLSLRRSAGNVLRTTENARQITAQLNQLINAVGKGEGPLGTLLTDSAMKDDLTTAVAAIREASGQTRSVAMQVNTMISELDRRLNSGQGTVHALLTDSSAAEHFRKTMSNIETATEGFKQNMEALKHNFLFRGYFRKLEKQQRRSGESSR